MPDARDADDPEVVDPSARGRERPVRPAHIPWHAAAWVVIVAVVAAGAAAQIARPLAPDLGPVHDPARWFAPDLLDRIAAYRGPLRIVGVLARLGEVAVPLAVAATPLGRRVVHGVVARVGAARPVRAAVVVVLVVVALTGLLQVPLALWAYRHARAFGLSTQSLTGWAGDWAIARGIELVVAALLVSAGWALLRHRPRDWHLIAAPAGVVLVALAVVLSPLLVEPLRYDLRPLPDGRMHRTLQEVLAADGRAGSELLVADASRRTTTQNAYVSGLWGTRRVVLYDTLLERPPAQVAQVLAHELAHERHHDLLRGVLAGAAGWALLCPALAAWLWWRAARRPQAQLHDPHAVAAVVVLVAFALALSTPVQALLSRRAEAAADLGALELTRDATTFCAMQRGLVARNLSDPAPPAWQRLWSWSHPSGTSRLALAAWWSSSAGAAGAAVPGAVAAGAGGVDAAGAAGGGAGPSGACVPAGPPDRAPGR